MSFEKKVLELAESIGIEDSYFAYGTMFVSLDGASRDQLAKFVKFYRSEFFGRPVVTLGAEEIAIDFVLN
jgi:hypothetical protein